MESEDIYTIFENVYDEYNDAIFRYLYSRISHRDDALELSQEVFRRFWDYLRSKPIENNRAFIYRVAHNLYVNHLRDRKNVIPLSILEEQNIDIEDTKSTSTLAELEKNELLTHIQSLDEKPREIFTLRYLDGLAVKEIAETLEETESNVSVIIHRELKHIREQFNPDEDKKQKLPDEKLTKSESKSKLHQ